MAPARPPGARGMRIGIVEPHLRCFGGIRRMIEFANRLVARGHAVTFYLPDGEHLGCDWMRCDAAVKPIGAGRDDDLDVVIFNHEPQWYLLDRFRRARRRVFYALHDGHAYGKEGSWEAVHAAVDLRLANSGWTADRIAMHTGERPVVQLGGVNREMFHPAAVRRRYPLLCSGERQRAWKGTATIVEAARIAGVPLRAYAGRGLSQEALGREYASARVFVVGSWYEGFCQPGLEALACGTPLVTTDNGGCREYAYDGETALVVPPRDAPAMAAAVRRLLDDPDLASRLEANGFDLVARDFDWEKRTDEFAAVLDGVCAAPAGVPVDRRAARTGSGSPRITVAVFADRDLVATQRLVDSVRWGTDVPFELLIVDPGDDAAVSEYATAAADRVVAGDAGPVAARNAALAGAAAPYLVCCRPGSVVPADWASALVAAAENAPGTAVVVPDAVAASRVDAAGGGEPEPLSLALLAAAPPVVLFVSDRVRAVGGWDETYDSVGAADSDLGLRLRADGCDALHHRGVVVTERWTRPPRGASRLSIGARDRATLAARWSAAVPGAGRADGAPGPDSARAAEVRTAAASLLRELADAAERERRDRRFLGRDGPVRGAAREWAKDRWRSVRPRLPNGLADRVGAFARRLAG